MKIFPAKIILPISIFSLNTWAQPQSAPDPKTPYAYSSPIPEAEESILMQFHNESHPECPWVKKWDMMSIQISTQEKDDEFFTYFDDYIEVISKCKTTFKYKLFIKTNKTNGLSQVRIQESDYKADPKNNPNGFSPCPSKGTHPNSTSLFSIIPPLTLTVPSPPKFPISAKMAGVTDTIRIRIKINPDGAPYEVKFIDGNPLFKKCAIDYALGYRFKAATANDVAIKSGYLLTLPFKLKPTQNLLQLPPVKPALITASNLAEAYTYALNAWHSQDHQNAKDAFYKIHDITSTFEAVEFYLGLFKIREGDFSSAQKMFKAFLTSNKYAFSKSTEQIILTSKLILAELENIDEHYPRKPELINGKEINF